MKSLKKSIHHDIFKALPALSVKSKITLQK